MATLHVASISDIHLGHRHTTTREIITNLKLTFADNAEMAQLDMIFVVGDVFDRLLHLSDDDVWDIKLWIVGFLRLCKKHDIQVIVLKGTPSHDWDQSKIFPTINEAAEVGCDLRYVDRLSIEYIEKLNLNILCVPDELEGGPDKTLERVKGLLWAKGLQQVDFALMHGQFEYQLPAHVKSPKHDSQAYLELVRYLIFIGHVHTSSYYMDRIYAQGSFDRTAHGQEEAKGHLRAVVNTSAGEWTVAFVENKGAKRYVTIPCAYTGTDEALELIDQRVAELPDDSYVRVETEKGHPITSNLIELVKRYPQYHWTALILKSEAEQHDEEYIDDGSEFIPITITKENVSSILMDRLFKLGIPSEVHMTAERLLAEVMNEL